MPRIKASPKKCVKTSNPQNPANQWVFLLKDAMDVPDGFTGNGTPDVVKLRHPQSGSPAMFSFSPNDGMVQEVLTFSENRRSWFIEDSVKSDGKMHLSTPIDPIFLVLPYLRKSPQTQPLDQILKDDSFPETGRLLASNGLKHLDQVADRKGDASLNAYKYNEEKTLNWLQRKTQRVAEALKQKGVDVGGGATAATFIKSGKQEAGLEECYIRYAHGILSEYLTEDLGSLLAKHLNLAPTETNKRKLGSANNFSLVEPAKKQKQGGGEDNSAVLDLTKREDKVSKTNTLTANDKARAKAAGGSKKISAFFKKK